MKNSIRNLGGLACLGVMLLTANITLAQTSTTTTTTSTGTVSQFSPDTLVVKSTTSTEPVSYSYTKTTTYVDENGNPVSIETVKSGLPVTVYYDTEGGKMVATKVVVKKTVTSAPLETTTTRTTTTTSAGTISAFSPTTIAVKSGSSPEAQTYSYTKTTAYVDESGNPVSIETVKSGEPVTVYYDTEDGKMVATKVIVRKTTTTTTPNP
jgi:uncharacterized protein YbcV (DUF1398 family)